MRLRTLPMRMYDPSRRCAVVGCKNPPKPHVCPHDGSRHGHGCVHYHGDCPKHSLEFHKGSWIFGLMRRWGLEPDEPLRKIRGGSGGATSETS